MSSSASYHGFEIYGYHHLRAAVKEIDRRRLRCNLLRKKGSAQENSGIDALSMKRGH